MYDEPVKRLRYCCDNAAVITDDELMAIADQAADAIEELLQKTQQLSRWIPVTERLPSENGLYFCCWKAQCDDKLWIIRLANWRADTGWMNMYDEPMKEPISHWMPLPEPPKEESNGV